MTAPPFEAALFIIGSILLAWASHFLLWRRLILKSGLPDSWRASIGPLFASLAALFPVGMLQLLLMRHVPRHLASLIMWCAFTWLGFVIFLVWALVVFEGMRLVVPAAFSAAHSAERGLARFSILGAVVVTVFSLIQAGERPDVRTTQFEVADDLAGYRIVQLSDLHIGPTLGRTFAGDVVQRTNALDADLIVISGDLVDGSVAELAAEVAPLATLHAKDGVVFALGNHEYLSGVDEWVRHVESFGWHVLRDERLSLPRLDIVGLDEFSDPESGIYADLARRAGREAQPDLSRVRPTIVVSHSPRSFESACMAGVDLALAGHTHGGQIFPFGLLEQLQQGYLAGPYRCGRTHLHVSSGTGYWGPPMRLGSHGEISLLALVPHLETGF